MPTKKWDRADEKRELVVFFTIRGRDIFIPGPTAAWTGLTRSLINKQANNTQFYNFAEPISFTEHWKLVAESSEFHWCKLKNEISKLTDDYFDTDPNSQDVNTNWTFFRDNLTTLMNNTIPHCNTKAKTHLPWISRELIRMQRRQNKSHQKAKQTGLNKHWEQFRELRRQTTKALATSYKS